VHSFRPSLRPAVDASPGGVWLVDFGAGSDAMDEEMNAVLDQVDGLLAGPRPKVILAKADSLASLFAPSNPQVIAGPGVLMWIIDADALGSAPELIQRLIQRIQRIGAHETPPLQMVVVRDVETPAAQTTATLFGNLGIDVLTPEPAQGMMLIEVERPEGVTLCAFPGVPFQPAAAPADGERRVSAVDRAPRLNRLLLAAADGEKRALKALHTELLEREIPLLFIVDENGRAALAEWPGGVRALAVYGDRASLFATAEDRGLALGTFGVAEMPPRQLFAWAAGNGQALALNVFRTRQEPIYIPLPPEAVAALARGEAP
jgi:hypothetical protein